MRIRFGRKIMGVNLKDIDFRKYIDEIQNTIGQTAFEIGLGHTKRERDRGKRRLSKKIRELSDQLTLELGIRGDYNIANMLTTGMIACTWSTFILKAKSLDKRRSSEDRKVMARIVEDMLCTYEEVMRQAVNYGKIYDKGDRKPMQKELEDKRREAALQLFNIQNGNVCALCERQLNWLADASEEAQPIALDRRHAICKECFKKLKEKYP